MKLSLESHETSASISF